MCAGCWPGRACPRAWSHDRAHLFFARARWNADDLGAARLVVALPVPAGEPVLVAIDDTLFTKPREEDVYLELLCQAGL